MGWGTPLGPNSMAAAASRGGYPPQLRGVMLLRRGLTPLDVFLRAAAVYGARAKLIY